MKVVAGNWKMHHGPAETRAFLEAFASAPVPAEAVVLLFPPTLSLGAARAAVGEAGALAFGVQNVHPEASGAFTGEISAEMAREAGAAYTLVGHSERRHLFGESDEATRLKVAAAYRAGLVPVLCVGETLEERRAGALEEVLVRQLEAVVSDEGIRARIGGGERFLLAYEPVWAIGTGETATPDDASEAHGLLKAWLRERVGGPADEAPVLYGGSVKPSNARELLASPGVDGVLVGGASLDPDSFAAIATAAG